MKLAQTLRQRKQAQSCAQSCVQLDAIRIRFPFVSEASAIRLRALEYCNRIYGVRRLVERRGGECQQGDR